MSQHKIKLLILLCLFSSSSLSAIKSENEKLIEELTGQTAKQATAISTRHLQAGLKAFENKNYIIALKHYNTVIIKHSKSKEVRSAYLAKSKLYFEMGLDEQAQLNSRLAIQQSGNNIKK